MPTISRLVIDGPPLSDLFSSEDDERRVAEAILATAMETWSGVSDADFMITPGGFLLSPLPPNLSGGTGWNSDPADLTKLVAAASRVLEQVVTTQVCRLAKGKCRYLTLGIDVGSPEWMAAELVALVDLSSRTVIRWTGKSYPTSSQERTLIQVVDLNSHLVHIADQRVLILGCHDLNMFSPRAWASQLPGSPRRQRCTAMRSLVKRFSPTVVLHHPHQTDTPRIWRMPWLCLADQLKVGSWASGICFYNGGNEERGTLSAVLASTRSTGSVLPDIIVKTRRSNICVNGHPIPD